MSYFYFNSKYLNHISYFWNFKELLKQAGWVVTSSGTGTGGIYNPSGDSLINSTDFGIRSWYVASHPTLDGYQRHLCFQLGNSQTTGTGRIKIAWTTYSSGSPSANTTPTSSDEQILYGSGTDASPTMAGIMHATDLNNNVYMSAGDVTEKYNFYFISYPNLTAPIANTTHTLFGMQYVMDADPLDIDPYIYLNIFSMNNDSLFIQSGFYRALAWYRKGMIGSQWLGYCMSFFGGGSDSNTLIGKVGNDLYDNSVSVFPSIFARAFEVSSGIKGTTKDINFTLSTRDPLFTLSINGIRDKIYITNNIIINHSGVRPLI